VTRVDPDIRWDAPNPRKGGQNLQELQMYFLFIGLVALVVKYLEIEPVAALSWWIVLLPFALAVAWWAWADASGYTKRKEIDKMDARKQHRIDKQRKAMGMLHKKKR
jgi:small Trp-rich protein